MIVSEVVEEITEKLNWANPNYGLSMNSILRKITQVRDDLIRNYGPAQRQSEPILTQYDLLQGQSEYPLPCPPGNVIDVDVKGLWRGAYEGYYCGCDDGWVEPMTYNTGTITSEIPMTNASDCWFRLPLKQFDMKYCGPYYYFLSGTIGLIPMPCNDVTGGLKIFHIPVLSALTVDSLNGPTGFDPNFDMVLVYGVLRDALSGPQAVENNEKYQQWLYDYKAANSGWERYVVNERW